MLSLHRIGEGASTVRPMDRENEYGLRRSGVGSRTWILMDSSGQEAFLDVDKYALMHRLQIHARDLRILDPQLSYPLAILSRKGAIVVNLGHIKAIITHREVFLRDPMDVDVEPVVKDLRRRLRPMNSERNVNTEIRQRQPELENGEDSPFELRVLEVALEAICSYLSTHTSDLEAAIYPALDMLTSKVTSDNLDRARKLKSQMTRLTARVQKLRDELELFLDDDDHIQHLHLSRNTTHGPDGQLNDFETCGDGSIASNATIRVCSNDTELLEMLFEACFMQMDGTLNRLAKLREYIDSTEGYINIQHESRRNQLIQLELFLTAGSLSLSFYGLVAGIFGVSIPYSWSTGHAYVFKWVNMLTGTICISIFMVVFLYARFKGLV